MNKRKNVSVKRDVRVKKDTGSPFLSKAKFRIKIIKDDYVYSYLAVDYRVYKTFIAFVDTLNEVQLKEFTDGGLKIEFLKN